MHCRSLVINPKKRTYVAKLLIQLMVGSTPVDFYTTPLCEFAKT